MSSSIGVALIGYGFVGENFHAPLIEATHGLKLVTISSSKPEKVHQRFPSVTVTNTPQEAIDRPDVQLVAIASPNTSHVPLSQAALQAGKHVVCDKPFTITTEEARALATLASQKQLVLSVFHNRRWDADFLTLRKLIADGTLGDINYFESHMDRFRPEVRDRWREQPGPGAGLWYDLGPHLIDQALVLFGMPETVQATIFSQRPGAKVDDYAHVVLGFAHGLQAVLHGTMLAPGGAPRFVVYGNKSGWAKYGLDVQEPQLISGTRPADKDWAIDPIQGTLFTVSKAARNAIADETKTNNLPGSYESYYAGVRDAILGKGPNPVPVEEAIRVMQVLESAHKSAETGQRTRLTPERH